MAFFLKQDTENGEGTLLHVGGPRHFLKSTCDMKSIDMGKHISDIG